MWKPLCVFSTSRAYGRQATDDEILTLHTPAYLEEIKAADAKPEPVRIDGGRQGEKALPFYKSCLFISAII
jgi:hypothetical protein